MATTNGSKTTPARGGRGEKNRPALSRWFGQGIVMRCWKNENTHGTFWTIQVAKRYKVDQDGEWKETTTFSDLEALTVSEALRIGWAFIEDQKQSLRDEVREQADRESKP